MNVEKKSNIPYQQIIDMYNEILVGREDGKTTGFSKCRPSNNHRKQIAARWHDQLPTLKDWEIFFNLIFYSDFLCGRVLGRGGTTFQYACFTWITRPTNCDKILDEMYIKK